MSGFVEASFPTESNLIVEESLERYKQLLEEKLGVTGIELSDGDLVPILLGVIAPMAASLGEQASVVSTAIFRKFGTELLKVPYGEGALATGVTTWTLLAESGHYPARTIPAGTQLEADGKGFFVAANVAVAEGATTASVQVTAVERGPEYNGVTGVMVQVNPLDWVSEVVLLGETSGGSEEESDESYLERIVTEAELLGRAPITAENYARKVKNAPSSVLPSGVVVGRATAIDGYNPETHTFTATTAASSATLTAVSSFTGVTVGTELSGGGIPAGASVTELKTSESKLVMSAEATEAHTAETISAVGSYDNERCVTTFVTDSEGKELSAQAMDDLEEWLKGLREKNFLPFVRKPSYTTIYATFKVKVLPGYTAASVVANAKEAVLAYLSPTKWANPTAPTTGAQEWLNGTEGFNVVRYNALIGVIEATPGVAYVPSGSEGLSLGTAANPTGTSDVTMPGPAPLPSVESAHIVGSSA